MIQYRTTSALVAVVIASIIVYLIRRDSLQVRFALWWLSTAAAVVLFGFFPNIIDYVGSRFGVHYPPVLLLILAIGFILIKLLRMDIDRSSRERRLRRLAQRLAILEGRVGPVAANDRARRLAEEDDE